MDAKKSVANVLAQWRDFDYLTPEDISWLCITPQRKPGDTLEGMTHGYFILRRDGVRYKMSSAKTYVVAGLPRSGTTAAMSMLMEGGIPGLYRHIPYPERPYPHQTYEWHGNKLRLADVVGMAVKQFGSSLVDNMPDEIRRIYVIYMYRDFTARLLAHPSEVRPEPGAEQKELMVHMDNIQRITQDPRVERLVVLDYDDLVSDPVRCTSMLALCGWDILVQSAAAAINPRMRHASKRG